MTQSSRSAGAGQLTLWAEPPPPRPAPLPPHRPSSSTSTAAAQRAAPRAHSRQAIALAIIVGRGERGATIDELAVVTGWLVQSTCPIVAALRDAGWIARSDIERPTRSGSPAAVHVATAAGIAAAQQTEAAR